MRKSFYKYVLQSTAGMLGISVYILADTLFISMYAGADGLTVLNLVLPIYGLIFAIGAMTGIGSATRYALRKARGEADTDVYFLHSLLWCLIMSVPFMLAGMLAPEQVLRIMGADPAIAELGKDYLRIILTVTPLFMMNYTFTAFSRNDNAPAVAMAGSLSGSLFNVVFDYVFMFPMDLGLAGAALATAVSPAVTMSVCSVHFLGKHNRIGFRWAIPSVRRLFSCWQLGVSAFVGEMASAVTTLIFNVLILGIAGNTGVAAYGVIANISLVAMAIFNGITQGTQPLISRCFGQGKTEEARSLLRLGLFVSLLAEALILAGTWGATDLLIGIFNRERNEALLYYAHDGMRLYFLGYLFAGVNIMLVGYFSAVGRAGLAFGASMLRGVLAIGACAVLLSRVWGMNGIWLSFGASELLTFFLILIAQRKGPQAESL